MLKKSLLLKHIDVSVQYSFINMIITELYMLLNSNAGFQFPCVHCAMCSLPFFFHGNKFQSSSDLRKIFDQLNLVAN